MNPSLIPSATRLHLPGVPLEHPDDKALNMLRVAAAIAMGAKCRKRWVGAVVYARNGRLIGSGRNGSAPGRLECWDGHCPRGLSTVEPGSSYDTGPGSCIGVHAEANGLMWSDRTDREGGTIAIVSLIPGGHALHEQQGPCGGCARLIDGSGLAHAVWPGGEWSR